MASRRSKPKTAPVVPKPHHYHGEDGEPAGREELPFVAKQGGGYGHAWTVPLCDDYGMTCKVGEIYGAHFAQFLKANYESGAAVGMLSWIARAIDFDATDSMQHGYWVGFFSYLERLIFAEAKRRRLILDMRRLEGEAARVAAMPASWKATGGASK